MATRTFVKRTETEWREIFAKYAQFKGKALLEALKAGGISHATYRLWKGKLWANASKPIKVTNHVPKKKARPAIPRGIAFAPVKAVGLEALEAYEAAIRADERALFAARMQESLASC